MEFRLYVKSVVADIAKNEIRLVFVGKLTNDAMKQARELAFFATSESQAVDVSVYQLQRTIMGLVNRDEESDG